LGFTSSAGGTSKQNRPSFRTYGGGKISGVVAILPSSSRSTCSWATSTAHLLYQGAGNHFKPNKEDPHEGAPHEENNTWTLKIESAPHEMFLMRRKTKTTLPCAPLCFWEG
jgi:hypothetical protein